MLPRKPRIFLKGLKICNEREKQCKQIFQMKSKSLQIDYTLKNTMINYYSTTHSNKNINNKYLNTSLRNLLQIEIKAKTQL